MNARARFVVVSLLVLARGCALLASDFPRAGKIFPGIVKIQIYQLGRQAKVSEALEHLKAQVQEWSSAGPRFTFDEDQGLSSEMRNKLGDLARQSALAVARDFLPEGVDTQWEIEYSEPVGVEVIALDLFKRQESRKVEMRLRLWVAKDASTAALVLWVRRGGPFWRPQGDAASPGNDSAKLEMTEGLRYRRWGSQASVAFREGDPKLGPDLFGVLVGNVVVEISGLTYSKFPDEEGWFSSGLVEEELAWRIVDHVQSGLKEVAKAKAR